MAGFALEEAAVAVKFLIKHKTEFAQVVQNIPTFVADLKEIITLVEGAKDAAVAVESKAEPVTPPHAE